MRLTEPLDGHWVGSSLPNVVIILQIVRSEQPARCRFLEQELRATSSLARTSSTGGGRIRGSVPESLANRLGPLATETATAAPVAPSSNVRERLGTAPPPRTQPLESRLGRSVDQSRNNSQTVSRRRDPPATANPASTAGPSTSAVPAEVVEPGSMLLWNRPDPSPWGQYKTDMSTKLNINTLTCRENAMRMIGGEGPTVSRLYRIPGVDWLLAEQEQFSSTTTLQHADLNGLPQDNTFGPLNTRLGEMPLPTQPAQPLIGAKRLRDGPGPSHSVDSPTAAPPPKRVRVNEIEIQTSETIETLEKKERDQSELCAKLQEYRAIARERDEWKKKYEDLQVAYKENEIKHLKELYMTKVSQVSQEVLATMNSSCVHREGPRLLSRHNSLLPIKRTRYQTTPTPISLPSSKNHSIKWQEQQWMRVTEPLDGHWVGSSLPNVVIILQIVRSEQPARCRFLEQELRATSSLTRTSSTGGGRIRGSVPESLANRLGPLATETATAAPVAPSSNVRERLGTALPPRTQPLESRLGRSVDQSRNNSQTVSRRSDQPATANPASTVGPSTSAVPAEVVEPGSMLLWNRPDPSPWGQYKTDMSTKLNMNTLTCRESAMRMIGGEGPTVSRLYRIPGVD